MQSITIRRVLAPLLLAAACARGKTSPADASAARAMPESASSERAAEQGSLFDLESSWRDQSGATKRLADFRGRPAAIALVYTSCHGSCPLIVASLKRVDAALPEAQRREARYLLVSLDPGRDTPGRLAEWARSTGLDARWTLLAGDDGAVREIAAVLGVRYQRQQDGELAHGNAITVLDADGVMLHQQVGLDGAARTAAAFAPMLARARR